MRKTKEGTLLWGAGATTEGIIRWAAHMHNSFEVSPQIIKRNLVEMGVALRTPKESQQIRRYRELERYEKRVSENVGEVLEESAVSEAKVIELYKTQGLLLNEVAVKCLLTRLEVYEILRDAGLIPDYSKKTKGEK